MAEADPRSAPRTDNVYLKALIWGDRWDLSSGPITYDFWRLPDSFGWKGEDAAAFRKALAAWAGVADIEFREARGEFTDLNFLLAELDGPYAMQAGPNGRDSQGIGIYDREAFVDWFGQLQPGGFAFEVILHELGHALGLAHPHDGAGRSGVFPGVTPGDDHLRGDYGLNTTLYTVMSYNDIGEWWAPDSESSYGFVAGPMAFDIAAIQHIYGANMATGAGNDLYRLPGADGRGTFYSCIWDAGGVDRLTYSGDLDVTIDLRPAPLVGRHAGGYLSRAEGVHGGFTIANGVTIEDAQGGGGDDKITGNLAANRLLGGDGDDSLYGSAGDDVLVGGHGRDRLYGGSGLDTADYRASATAVSVDLTRGIGRSGDAAGDRLSSIDLVFGTGGDDLLVGSASGDRLFGGEGADRLFGHDGKDRLSGAAGNDRLTGGEGNDRLDGGDGDDRLYADGGRDAVLGGAGIDTVLLADERPAYTTGSYADGRIYVDGASGTAVLVDVEFVRFADGIVSTADLAAGDSLF